MRKYPPMASLSRTATTETRIPGTNYKLEKGQHIFIPTMAIHYDPDIYPDPDLFDPDRMTREKMKNRHPCSFLALGGGPRICLGYKFGLLQVKLAIVRILTKYHLNVDGRTKQPLNFLPHRLDFDVAGGVWLNAQPITWIIRYLWSILGIVPMIVNKPFNYFIHLRSLFDNEGLIFFLSSILFFHTLLKQ